MSNGSISWRTGRRGDILKLHGMGRKGIDTLEQALAERGLSFKKAEA
ncbi:hypothetical protein OMP38_18380 [Cohnella ginsengisoli]|uniref:DNA-binding protein n=1 Tax=Cohnella ginsengisoli TaxID=425004 RepID=A0A9X4KIH6_9BACL|nr:hypothetical protein [Cohnella ginsengisoli]MDG0792626.1 hypothetical protein [Cohnella ginsengisoli]